MKENSKKVPDAPKRLWVRTNSLIHDTGLMAVGNISFREYWIGHKNKVPKDVRPWSLEQEEEYISLSQSWHEAKEVPQDMHTVIIVANKDFSVAISISLAKECLFGVLDNTPNKAKWNKFRKNLKFAYWTYFKDIVPSKLKEGGRQCKR